VKIGALMIGYLTAAGFALAFLEPGTTPPGFTGFGAFAMIIIFLGAFHLAQMSRRPAVFLGFGGVGAFLPVASYLLSSRHALSFDIGTGKLPVDVIACCGFVAAIAIITRFCAVARWRLLTRKEPAAE
jgi:hypothetical protein